MILFSWMLVFLCYFGGVFMDETRTDWVIRYGPLTPEEKRQFIAWGQCVPPGHLPVLFLEGGGRMGWVKLTKLGPYRSMMRKKWRDEIHKN